jgi:hypothetical protein
MEINLTIFLGMSQVFFGGNFYFFCGVEKNRLLSEFFGVNWGD